MFTEKFIDWLLTSILFCFTHKIRDVRGLGERSKSPLHKHKTFLEYYAYVKDKLFNKLNSEEYLNLVKDCAKLCEKSENGTLTDEEGDEYYEMRRCLTEDFQEYFPVLKYTYQDTDEINCDTADMIVSYYQKRSVCTVCKGQKSLTMCHRCKKVFCIETCGAPGNCIEREYCNTCFTAL